MSKVLRDPKFAISIVFILTSMYIIEYFFKGTSLTDYVTQFSNWALVLAAFAMGFGFMNLIFRHGHSIIRSNGKDFYSIWLLFCMFVTFVFGTFGGLNNSSYQWIYQNVYQPISASFLSFSFIYMCSSAVRMFRIKGINETLLLIGCAFALAGNIPMFSSYTSIFVMSKEWLISYPSTGTFAAFNISVAMGVVLMGLRTMVGIERGWIGEAFRREE